MDSQVYDYIVVGAGSAGSVLANRLTASGQNSVLLLEAGRPNHPWTRVPIGFARLIDNPKANWLYESLPDEGSADRPIPVPRGKLLGGSSAINGMVFVRGQAQDFDTWAQLGNRGWSYRDVLPHFREMESYDGGDDEFRGREGPLRVTDTSEGGPLYDALIAAAAEQGIAQNLDYNGAVQEGIAMTQMSINKGRRMSTAYCYLDPARDRANLYIVTGALTESLLFDGMQCTGVRYTVGGVAREARAGREVIVSAGAVNSPQLLELSGIGQPELLKRHGIEVRQALPGVGENLRDHYAPRMKWEIGSRGLTYNDRARGVKMVWQALRYATSGKGLLGLPASPMRAYLRSREGLDNPDIGISWIPFLVQDGYRLHNDSGMTVITHPLRSESTGSIHIGSERPDAAPEIRFNFLSAEYDREVTLAAMEIVRQLMGAPTMKALGANEIDPGEAMQDNDELLDWVRATAETAYHPVGTCKMGVDDRAVVDEQLRVHGIQNLRVADASIMPTLTSGNTNAPSIMIGEKAAAMVLESAA
ncbi:MAG: GMC family oxidoreductase N-terminal domain-containing protein [Alphaproteobacteria bacterium]|jgi:choline dehydrogenase|nr:GMC family oxidoreductase N-terminal domain-containing protein [Alphaproteobacteria bacterium]